MDVEQTQPEKLNYRYAVFLSFCGQDTRRGFTDYLYHCLVDAGIYTFRDSEGLQAGRDVSQGLLRAIRGSRIALVVFSANYARSTWCLDELAEIMECCKTVNQIVFPMFFDVFPSDVRHQNGCLREAFLQHENRFEPEQVRRWRQALTEAANLFGWDCRNPINSQHGLLVRKIVNQISVVLSEESYLHVATFPVGLGSRVINLNQLLSSGSDGVIFVGILGMGGIGKTTLAKALYNHSIHQFEGMSFLADVRINSQQPNDLVRLQEQLLNDIFKCQTKKEKVRGVDRGKSIIKKRLCSRKVLVILDDVSEKDQVKALAGARDWFGSGSRIILTTRNGELLNAVKVDRTYKAEKLNDDESLRLFSNHAFEKNSPEEEFKVLSKQIASYCQGVPLALEVLGSSLMGKCGDKWERTIEKLKTIPDDRIHEKLRISYDALGRDDKLKGLFLDIACFFVDCNKDYAVTILEACGLFAKKGIYDLCSRCLIEVDEQNNIKMHDLIRDMGREIVREESPNDPGKRSRLWRYEDVKSALKSRLGTEVVEGIALDSSKELSFNSKHFKKMNRLRLLKFNNLRVHGTYQLMSKEVRWLYWHKFPLKDIPGDFDMGEVVAIDMQYSNLRTVYNDKQVLENLKFLDLSYSRSLTKTPDFLSLPNLEQLILEDCIRLADVHESIGHLGKLVLANFKGCKKLRKIPDSFSSSKSLKILNISGCSKIDKLPERLEQMVSLTQFFADGIGIAQVPYSISTLNKLTHLSLSGCKVSKAASIASVTWSWLKNTSSSVSFSSIIWSWLFEKRVLKISTLRVPSLSGLSLLKVLKLMDCGISDDEILTSIGGFLSLEELDLRKNNFSALPHSISGLPKLKSLLVDDCRNLDSLPDMPASLFSLSAINCTSLNRASMSNFGPGTRLFLSHCSQLSNVAGLARQEPDGSIHLEQCNNLSLEFKEFLIKHWCGRGRGNIFLPGSDIPDWFYRQEDGSSLVCTIPSIRGRKPKGFTICIIYASNLKNTESHPFPTVQIEPLNIEHSIATHMNVAVTHDDHMWVFHLPDSVVGDQLESVEEVKLSVQFGVGWNVKQIGVHFRNDAMANHCC